MSRSRRRRTILLIAAGLLLALSCVRLLPRWSAVTRLRRWRVVRLPRWSRTWPLYRGAWSLRSFVTLRTLAAVELIESR